jgi:hypothetical protein
MLGIVKYLPMELRLFCIIPYTYSLQNRELTCDIRTYKNDTELLDVVYNTRYNDTILLRDLKNFCQIDDIYTDPICLYVVDEADIRSLPLCFSIWKRYCLNYNLINSELYNKIIHFDNTDTSIRRKNMFIWGLFTPTERTIFINAYILETYN